MSETKWTPPPWKVSNVDERTVLDNENYKIARTRAQGNSNVPNARLIAAAPDLAAALEQAQVALASIPQGELKVEYSGDIEYWQVGELLVYIEEALAKARGEEVDDA